jgi:hypothetical protein
VASERSGGCVFRRARFLFTAACCCILAGALTGCTTGSASPPGASAAVPGSVLPRQVAGLVTRDGYAGHVEPDVAVSSRNPSLLLGACQFEVGSHTRRPGTFVSFDGGRTWTDNGLLPLPAGFELGADTTVGFDASGTGYVVALLSHGGGGYPSRVSRGGVFMWRTTDGGRRFAPPVPVYVGPGFQDHPWLAIDPSPPASLYIAWANRSRLEFAFSRDGGTAFSAPHLIVSGSAPSTPVVTVGASGTVHIFYQELSGPGQPTRLLVVSSADHGRSFTRPQPIGSAPWPPRTGGGPKGNTNTPPPLLSAATDPGSNRSAVAISGQDAQADHPVIYLWQNADTSGGWQGPSHPLAGAVPAVTQVQPRMIYISHRLYISYFAITRSEQITEQLAYQTLTGNFQPQALNSTPFHTAGFIGDYQALANSGHITYLFWNDAQSGRLEITAATITTS